MNYPMMPGFIESLPKGQRQRILNCGFAEFDDALLLEIPNCAVTGIGAGLIRDYRHRVFYPFMCGSKGVIARLDAACLRVVIDHEADEIRNAIMAASDPQAIREPTTSAQEEERHKTEFFDQLGAKYGAEIVTRTVREVAELSNDLPWLSRNMMLFWLIEYVTSNPSKIEFAARPMPDGMLSPLQRERHRHLFKQVDKEYAGHAPIPYWVTLFADSCE